LQLEENKNPKMLWMGIVVADIITILQLSKHETARDGPAQIQLLLL